MTNHGVNELANALNLVQEVVLKNQAIMGVIEIIHILLYVATVLMSFG